MSAEYSSRAASNVLSAGNQSMRSCDLSNNRFDSSRQFSRKPNIGLINLAKNPRNNLGTPSQIPPVGTYNVSYDPPVDHFHPIQYLTLIDNISSCRPRSTERPFKDGNLHHLYLSVAEKFSTKTRLCTIRANYLRHRKQI